MNDLAKGAPRLETPPVASTSPHLHTFNDDLLMNDHDLAYARSQWPQIIHVLHNPALREKFAQYEKEANDAREWVRRLGFATVASVTVALLAVATRPLWPHASWTRWPALVIELAGMVAAVVSVGGLWFGRWKHRWLESRLMTEQLYVRTGAITIALIGAALRTIDTGLGLDREIERYNDYRGRTSQLCDRFKHAMDAKERLHLMEEMELASVDEMKGFLRTHHNTRFIL